MLYYFLAYVTLFAIGFLIFFAVRITIRTVRYRKWRKFAVPAVGTVGELKDVTCNYDRKGEISSYRYNYALKIIYRDQEFDDVYSEECKPGSMPITRPGKKINILWSASDHKYLQIAKTDEEIGQVMNQECKFSLHAALLIFGNIRYFRDHHKSGRR